MSNLLHWGHKNRHPVTFKNVATGLTGLGRVRVKVCHLTITLENKVYCQALVPNPSPKSSPNPQARPKQTQIPKEPGGLGLVVIIIIIKGSTDPP